MQLATLKAMLDELSASTGPDGSRELPDGAHYTLLLSADGSLLPLPKVRGITLSAAHVTIRTAKGDRYLLDAAQIVGIKVGPESTEGTGFLTR